MLRPFRALRPVPERASLVSAPPYDVLSREEAARMAQGNPWSFLRISRPEIELPEGADPHSEPAYARAKESFERLRRECPLVLEDSPSLYVYRLRMDGREQTGVVAAFAVDAYESGAIRRHELTRRDKEDDRTRHILALRAQTGPVFLAYRGEREIEASVAAATAGPPLFDFVAPDGVAHALWRVPEPADLAGRLARVPRFYIADGHHRAAAAARARAELRAAGESTAGADYFVAAAFPADQLRILPYHRLVKDLNGLAARELLERLAERFDLSDDTTPLPARGELSLCLPEYGRARWRRLRPRSHAPADALGRLDVTLLQNLVLGPIFGIRDPRTDPRIEFVGGIRGTGELEARVLSGRAAAAFAMHPTGLDELMEIADAGDIMPPKSTWFEPKLRDGLFSLMI